MKFYLATKLERIVEAAAVISALRAKGHECTYDWTAHGAVWEGGEERMAEVSQAELTGVLDADVLIALLPGGRGTHIEIGAALNGQCIRVYLYGPPELFKVSEDSCAFYFNDDVTRVSGPLSNLLELF